jgi:2-oxo-4-hydroxy-4-carboxy-5-ureidoimidazoline decarboxylase
VASIAVISLEQLNALSRGDFVRLIGPAFEHSPWIADTTWPGRPFASREELHRALCRTVFTADGQRQLDLIRAHPDLAGRMAAAGALTAASTREQSAAGLDHLTPEEAAIFQSRNEAYREKFGFPFVICARMNRKEAMLVGFETRLKNTREEEIRTALEEIAKIAWLRLQDIVAE